MRAYEIQREAGSGRSRRHYLPAYKTITYGEIAERVEAIVSAWTHHPRHGIKPGEFVSHIGFSGVEMVTLDLAAVYVQVVGIPIQANLPAPDVANIFNGTDPAVLVASIDSVELATGYALQHPSFRSVIVIDADPADDDDQDQIEAARARLIEGGDRIALTTLNDLVAYGRDFEWKPLPRQAKGADAMSLLMYTSGSTETPKGALRR